MKTQEPEILIQVDLPPKGPLKTQRDYLDYTPDSRTMSDLQPSVRDKPKVKGYTPLPVTLECDSIRHHYPLVRVEKWLAAAKSHGANCFNWDATGSEVSYNVENLRIQACIEVRETPAQMEARHIRVKQAEIRRMTELKEKRWAQYLRLKEEFGS